ncbi:hypothetical protein CR513_16240, partial [Mucuna pruriens]
MQSSNSQKWIDAMKDELKSMQNNDVWDFVELPEGVKPIGCKWIYKTKKDSKGNFEIYKTHLVAKGFNQKEDLLHETKRFLIKNFEMKDLGEASFVLGIQILRDCSQDSKLRDTKIAKVDKFSFKQCSNNDLERNEMQKISYALALGSLMYGQFCTRLDIAFVVGVLGRFEIIGYFDSDFAGCEDSKRSTSRYIYMMTRGVISWKSIKQTLIAPSTMAVEFVACFEASNLGIWLLNFVTSLQVVDGIERPLKMYYDNNPTILYSNNNRSSMKLKFIDIQFLVVKERVQVLILKFFHEHTAHMGIIP